MRKIRLSRPSLFAVPIALAIAGGAQAISISGVTITTNGPNTANYTEDTTTAYAQNLSATSILDSGGTSPDSIASTVDARTRYAALVGADSGAFTNRTRTATADYKITFTVTAPALETYDLLIDTSRLGALTTVDETLGTGQATASVTGVTGRLNGVVNTNLGVAAATTPANAGGNYNVVLSQTNTLALLGNVGTQSFTLDFTWAMTADSTCTGFACSTPGTDEAAVRLGLAGTTSGTTAEDYPGVGGRTLANDGHFVNILATVTFVPEPGTAVLLGLGLVGVAARSRRVAAQ